MQLIDHLTTTLPETATIQIRAIHPDTNQIIQKFVTSPDELRKHVQDLRNDYDVYYGPAAIQNGATKTEGFVSTSVLWCDIDHGDYQKTLKNCILPPSCIYSTGTGVHVYWLLDSPSDSKKDVQTALKAIQSVLGADPAVTHPVAILRPLESFNHKYDPPKETTPTVNDGYVYELADFSKSRLTAAKLIIPRLHTEKSTGDRSENDYAVLQSLAELGFSRTAIENIAVYYPFGEKCRDRDDYLTRTLDKILDQRASAKDSLNLPQTIVMNDPSDGYYSVGAKGTLTKISVFTLEVQSLQRSTNQQEEDIFIVSVRVGDKIWKDVLLPVSVFNRSATFRDKMNKASWTWLGSDKDTISLNNLLVQQWLDGPKRKQWIHKRVGHNTEHNILVTSKGIYNVPDLTPTDDHIFHSKTDHPKTRLQTDLSEVDADFTPLMDLNHLKTIAPILGWFAATPLKAILNDNNISFPHLALFGTRGAGKTTVINLMQRLLGFERSQTWAYGTTPFAVLSLLSSSTTIPVCFTEFRTGLSTTKFEQQLRIAYDSGVDIRGRPDQTTVEYPLSAPICLDGENPPIDPAIEERTITTYLNVTELQKFEAAFLEISQNFDFDLHHYTILERAYHLDVIKVYRKYLDIIPQRIPSRIRSNIAVVCCGLHIVGVRVTRQNFMSYFAQVLEDVSLDNTKVVSTLTDFLDYVISSVTGSYYSGKMIDFPWSYRPKGKDPYTLSFQLSTAYAAYKIHCNRQGVECLDKRAIGRQLREAIPHMAYLNKPQTTISSQQQPVHMHSINLADYPNYEIS